MKGKMLNKGDLISGGNRDISGTDLMTDLAEGALVGNLGLIFVAVEADRHGGGEKAQGHKEGKRTEFR
jgi:hypothetical protein